MSQPIMSFARFFVLFLFVIIPLTEGLSEDAPKPAELTQIGSMHETIGKGQYQGRVSLSEIVENPHFYGIGAVEELKGEITILDSEVFITSVTKEGHPQSMDDPSIMATMLIGQTIAKWMSITLTEDVSHEEFDMTIGGLAGAKGIDTSKPFVFILEGTFRDVRIHIINGACPLHARMNKIELEKEKQAFELEDDKVRGTLVGIYAEDSTGKLTHPGTNIHAHLITIDERTGKRITAHIEQIGLAKDGVLRFPANME